MNTEAMKIIRSRRSLMEGLPAINPHKREVEGGCGVTGFASSIPIRGRHIFEPSIQMHNRGNGKGGGIAALGFDSESMGIDANIIENDYLLQIAYLDPSSRKSLEEKYIIPHFDIFAQREVEHIPDFRALEGLEVSPPDIWQYFVRVKKNVLADFSQKNELGSLPQEKIEDEFISRNSFNINNEFYSSIGEKQAFVLSHGKNIMIIKIVGYAEQAVEYYKLENFKAHAWIAHQRYPTKGRVWHPGGAHPFCGMHEALVHNGDFANYYATCEYLRERNIYPLFLTDTEVSVLVFDLLSRMYNYPLEYIIEALAPTTELDFNQLPEEKKKIYRMIQAMHIHGSPDGPWFFIIARNNIKNKEFQLLGITDTAMLRPQVFALHEGEVQVGLICSEKQAIDATLNSMSQEDPRISPVASKYWNARGGSYSDGGAFIFNLSKQNGGYKLTCRDKFGGQIKLSEKHQEEKLPGRPLEILSENGNLEELEKILTYDTPEEIFAAISEKWINSDFETIRKDCMRYVNASKKFPQYLQEIIEVLTLLNDRHYNTGSKRRASILRIVRNALDEVFDRIPLVTEQNPAFDFFRLTFEHRNSLPSPKKINDTLVIDARGFPAEGENCESRLEVKAYELGWRRFIVYRLSGQRFTGCGFGPNSEDVHIDVYGSSGDYLASGIDGMEIFVHNDAQDQLCQIMKAGKVVIHGSVGQTFMYGAKGGSVFVKGNAAGRPLINGVGKPKVIINGTCLDYLAESFMAGDPLKGGGFAIVNGIEFDEDGDVINLPTPYPGSNLFSLASGGAIYIRDPKRKVGKETLNGGVFARLTDSDWQLILPYLQENERLFGISIDKHLLTIDGQILPPNKVYRKVISAGAEIIEMESDDL